MPTDGVRHCPDDGYCHHKCGPGECFRVKHCEPLSGVYENDKWPDDVLREFGAWPIAWLERAAAAEHESWSGWMKWMRQSILQDIADLPLPIKERNEIRKIVFELPCMERWKRQMETPYADLSEKEKESDREEARKKAPSYDATTPRP